MRITLHPSCLTDYETFLRIKRLPQFRFAGRTATFPDEYASLIGVDSSSTPPPQYEPIEGLFDYQRDIARMCIEKERFAVFADCGLGKTRIIGECARFASAALPDRRVLIVSPLMVVKQTLAEFAAVYGDSLRVQQVRAAELPRWLSSEEGEQIAITNYEALTNEALEAGRLGALILDESSMLKSHYGKWGTTCLRLGAGLRYKWCFTGTPAPNDRIEYANHAVFLGASPTINAFLARYFVNRGQTQNRWELKPHAIKPFYQSLSHWCIFLTNPATYQWEDNCEPLPPIHVSIETVPMTDEQQQLAYEQTGRLIADQIGGITSRSVLSQIGKGSFRGRRIASNKPRHIADSIATWPDESTIIWCHYNAEQEIIADAIPEAESIDGNTPLDRRERIIDAFKAGDCRVLISKPKILGFGLNLEVATRQVFSGLQDSYESYYQAVKRSNRYGATRPLNVHIPVTDIERPMIETVLAKASRVSRDTEEQERIFQRNQQC